MGLRLDADEYLSPEICEEVKGLITVGGLPTGVLSPLCAFFCGRRVHFGGTD